MRMRSSALAAVGAVIMIVLAGCGSGGSSSTTAGGRAGPSDAGSAVVRAADVTGSSSGYRFQATMSITGASSLKATMSGTILRAGNRGTLALRERLRGHSVNVAERYSGKTYWVSVAGIPGGSALTGKPWLRYNLGSTLNQLGVGGLPSGGSNPTQFLTYLKASGADAQKLGTQTVRGVATTRFAVTVN